MNWVKKGLIYNVNGNYDWNKSHAQCPVVDVINDKVWRIYYSTRNNQGQSQISFIEVEAGKPEHILYEHNTYLFELGAPGTFDDSGVMPTSIVTYQGVKYLYYIGWTIKQTVPYHNSIGIAKSIDNGKTFTKMFSGSIMPSIHTEPYFTGTAYVNVENHLWRMWYLSCVKWETINGKKEPYYHIKYAESHDGVHWQRDCVVAIDFKDANEGGIVSASVIKENGSYKMWYAFRAAEGYRSNKDKSYRIGYAESLDGIVWSRLDEAIEIDRSNKGWDSEMMSYPNVINHDNKKFMFYNGNGFGQTGFGYAMLE